MRFWKWFKIKFSWKVKPLWKSESSEEIKKRINNELEKRIREETKR